MIVQINQPIIKSTNHQIKIYDFSNSNYRTGFNI